MRAVNLLPRDAAQAKSIRNEDPAVVVGSVFGVIVIIALSAGFITAHSKASSEQTKLTAARIELGKLSLHKHPVTRVKSAKPTRPLIPIPAVTSEEQPRLQAIAGALSTRIAWDRILREFSLVVPDDITISALSMTAPTGATDSTSGSPPASSGNGLVLSGLAYSHDSVARLLSRLMLIPDLTDVTLSSSTASATGGTGVQFNINATVKGAPVPAAATTPAATTTTDTTTTTGSSS
jgi:Tfp pilus assembly protein PilN